VAHPQSWAGFLFKLSHADFNDLNHLLGGLHDLNHMGIVLFTLMRPDTAGVHRRARVMVIVELSPTAGVTVTERGGVRNAATAGMGGMSAAHAASTTATVRIVASAAMTRCGSAAGVPVGGKRETSETGRGRRRGREEGSRPHPRCRRHRRGWAEGPRRRRTPSSKSGRTRQPQPSTRCRR